MSDAIRTVRLYGKLGAIYGREFKLAVSSPAEAIRALCAMIPGFERYLMNSRDQGVGYSVFVGKRNLQKEELRDQCLEDIRIAPMIVGSKSAGLFTVIMGAVLVVVGAVLTYFGFAAIGVPLMKMGVAVIIGGVIQMLAPQPKGLGSQDGVENQAGYNFNGAVNTQAQGNPVPLLYGRLIIGSAVISAGITAEDIIAPIVDNGSGVGSGGDSSGQGGGSNPWHGEWAREIVEAQQGGG